MIDWKKFEDAVRVAVRYYDDNDRQLGQTIATRPTQTKTVANAVEQPNFRATRKNLEKIAKDAQGDFVEVGQESDKWTHMDEYQNPCLVVMGKPDADGNVVILRKDGLYDCVHSSSVWLKPIKPTLTKAEAWDKAVLAGNMSHITDNYDII